MRTISQENQRERSRYILCSVKNAGKEVLVKVENSAHLSRGKDFADVPCVRGIFAVK